LEYYIILLAGNYGQEHQALLHSSTSAPSRRDDCLTHAPQLELIGHSFVSLALMILFFSSKRSCKDHSFML